MNKKGFASIILGMYLLLILFIMGSVLYGVQYMTGSFSSKQYDAFQNDYNLERGVYYALEYISNNPAVNETYSYIVNWPQTPDLETAHIVITAAMITTPPEHFQYTVKSSTPTPAPAGRPIKTITVVYDRGRIISYAPSTQ